MNDRF